MKHLKIITALSLSIFIPTANAATNLKVHEWGTFTSLVGSNGITQPGMYHEDERLPDFVHSFGATQSSVPGRLPPPSPPARPPQDDCGGKSGIPCRELRNLGITQKMETPVVYFYTNQSQTVDVRVRFPKGVIGETYPAPIATYPTDILRSGLRDGDTTFRVDVLNTKDAYDNNGYPKFNLPKVDASNIYSHARNVAANIMRTNTEYEKFIFYRGLGKFQPSLKIHSSEGNLSILASPGKDVPAAFLIHVNEEGETRSLRLGSIESYGGGRRVDKATLDRLTNHVALPDREISIDRAKMKEQLVQALVAAGLYTDEANAMVATWEHGYLKVPGLRLLYVLPRREVEDFLPMTVTPKPDELNRVFVGRIEIMTDQDERLLVSRIVQNRCVGCPQSLGRFAEPILRRGREVYLNDQSVQGGRIDKTVLARFDEYIDRVSGVLSTETEIH